MHDPCFAWHVTFELPPGESADTVFLLGEAQDAAELRSLLARFPDPAAVERGFDLPKPLGLNVLGLYMKQDIDITNLGLSTGDNALIPIDFIKFGRNSSSVSSISACPARSCASVPWRFSNAQPSTSM